MYTTLIAAIPGDPHLATALASVFGQSALPAKVEVITDANAAVPDHWRTALLTRYPDVRFRVHSGSGMVRALNAGIADVDTPFVAFLDCDDIWHPEKQARQLARLHNDDTLDAVGCRAVTSVMGDRGTTLATPDAGPDVGHDCHTFTGTTFRTATFERFGDIDSSAGHFTWLYRWWSNARRSGIKTACIDYIGLERRVHAGNSWVIHNDRAHRDLLAEIRNVAAKHRASV